MTKLTKIQIEARIIQADLRGDEAEVLRLLRMLNLRKAKAERGHLRLLGAGEVAKAEEGQIV